jgi:hypothetical protein
LYEEDRRQIIFEKFEKAWKRWPQQVIDNSEKELKIGPIFGLKTAFLGVKRAL